MLDGVVKTAQSTSKTVIALREKMNDYKHRIRDRHPSIYSQDLLNTIFSYPYTRIKILQERISVSYLTARKYLDVLTDEYSHVKAPAISMRAPVPVTTSAPLRF